MKKTAMELVSNWKTITAALVTTALLFGGVVQIWGNPWVDGRIDVKLVPVHDALEYQTAVMLHDIPDSSLELINRRYIAMRKARGGER